MTTSIPDPLLFSATLVRKLIDCQSVNGFIAHLTPPWDQIVQAIDCCPLDPHERNLAFQSAIAQLSNHDQIRSAVFAADLRSTLDDFIVDDLDDTSDIEIPQLPSSVLLPASLGNGICPWLDDYVSFSKLWAPRSYSGFHETIGLWILSTTAARRVSFDLGKPRFTNLYLALVARTSFFAKTTAAEIAIDVIRSAGLTWLLANDSSTPQKFLADQADHTIPNYDDISDQTKKDWAKYHAWSAGQRGWFYEEFGQQIHNMLKEGGFMAEFRGILRIWDDAPLDYKYGTIGRGTDKIDRPYLALLANMTPDDLRPFAKRGSSLWGDGFLARYALITPPDSARGSGRFPSGKRNIPKQLTEPLKNWNQELGFPVIEIKDVLGKDNKPSGLKKVEFTPKEPTLLDLSSDVIDAYYAYHDGLLDSISKFDNHDLDGNYSRMAEKAMRVAALLASVSRGNQIQLAHWARAQAITERWRAGLHELYNQINTRSISQEREKEEDVLRILTKHGPSTAAEVARYVRNLSTGEARRILDELEGSGVLKTTSTQKSTKRYEII